MLSHILKTQMSFKAKCVRYLPCIRIWNLNRILKGQLKKFRLISGGSIKTGLFNHTTFKELWSRVPVPLRGNSLHYLRYRYLLFVVLQENKHKFSIPKTGATAMAPFPSWRTRTTTTTVRVPCRWAPRTGAKWPSPPRTSLCPRAPASKPAI